MTALADKRVLVVEDEALVADMLVDMLVEIGAVVVGPAASIPQALALVRTEDIDAAILDVNVRNERIDPVAALLQERGVPIVYATGYGQTVVVATEAALIVEKPYTKDRIVAALSAVWQALGPGDSVPG